MRDRHEASIKRLERNTEASFERALSSIVFARGAAGQFDFFTAEQIEDIRAMMVRKAWSDHKFRKHQRAVILRMRQVAAQDMVGVFDE